MNFETGLFASGVALADFNLDGALDMAVSNQNAANVSILSGDGRGHFGAKTDFPAGGPPQRIIAADLNRDGKLDLILPIQASKAHSHAVDIEPFDSGAPAGGAATGTTNAQNPPYLTVHYIIKH